MNADAETEPDVSEPRLALGVLLAGVRFAPHGALVFCRVDPVSNPAGALERGRRVRVVISGEAVDAGAAGVPREGVVVLAPRQIIAAPPLDSASWSSPPMIRHARPRLTRGARTRRRR